MLTLVLTRHGLTDRSVPDQHLGQRIDVSLNEAGRRQAAALAARLAGIPFDAVVTSPLFRARETAEILAPGRAVVADPRLRELDYGAWEGRPVAEVLATDGPARRAWEAAPDTERCPGGESGADVAARVTGFLDDLLAEQRHWYAREAFRAATEGVGVSAEPERLVLVVAHSTLNRILLSVALGTDLGAYRRRWLQGHLNLTVLRWRGSAGVGEAQLVVANDRAHLRGPGEPPWD